MSEHTYPLELLRAELSSAISNLKVDLIDRFASKQELATLRQAFATHEAEDDKHFREINTKLDTLFEEKQRRDGASEERKGWLDSRKFTITTIVALSCGLVSAVATLVWLATG